MAITLVAVLGELLTAIASIAMLTAPSLTVLNVDYWMVRLSQNVPTAGNKKVVDTPANDNETIRHTTRFFNCFTKIYLSPVKILLSTMLGWEIIVI